MKFIVEHNKTELKKAIKDLQYEYGRRDMLYTVTIWEMSGSELLFINNEGQDYRYEICIEVSKYDKNIGTDKILSVLTHKASPSNLSYECLGEKFIEKIHKEQDKIAEWIEKTYIQECKIERDIKRV